MMNSNRSKIRASGVANAKVEDILWKDNTILIYGAKNRDPESADPYFFDNTTKQALKNYLENREEGYIFVPMRGEKYTRFGVRDVVIRVAKKMGLDLTAHSGKTFYLTGLHDSGEYTLNEMRIAGHHADGRTTEGYFVTDEGALLEKIRKASFL